MTGYYAVRNADKPRTWRDGWLGTVAKATTNGIVTIISGVSEMGVGPCDKFSTIEEARSFVMLVVVTRPKYLGRLVIHHVEWGTSGHKWLIGQVAE